ncbi:retrovirus-related pol polyprotein from transposon TNT 1-94 [Tanacetum coccineum]
MWQSEVLDALFQKGLDIAVEESKPEDVEERNWLTINRLACGTICSCLSREQRYAFSKETSAYKLWVALEEKFMKKNCQNKLFMKKRLFHFTYVPGTTMNDHITSFNQLVTDLMNMDEVFKDQDPALILLGSLIEEYELLETTLLNRKDDVSLSEVCTALYSKELRRNRSKSRQRLSKDECAFCHEKSHWKRDCPRLKTKDNHYKGKAVAEANVTKCDDEESDLSLVTSSSRNDSEIWQLDSACSHHITPHREWFSNFEEHEEVVYTADETPLTTHGIGSIRLQNEDGTIVTLKGVRYSSKLKKNLIFVGTIESKGFEVRAKCGVMKIISGVLVVMKGIRKINNTYYYKGRTVAGTVAAVTDGLSSCKLDLCEHCINGKTTRVKFGTAIHKTQGILDYVHSDVWGPSKTRSLGGRHYYVTFVDDFSRRVWVYTLKTKDEVPGVHFTVKHTPQQNGVAERMNRTLLEKVRCMLSNAGLGKEFWAEVVTYACHLINRLPSTAIDGKTPFEKWYGKPALDYDSLHVFGSAAYYHVKESKLNPRAKKALFMGITSRIKGYRLWCPETKKTIFSRDVTFNESSMLKKVNVEQLDGTPKKVEFERIIIPADREPDDNSPMVEGDYEEEEVQAKEPRQQQHESIATSKPKRNTKRPARLNDTVACASSSSAESKIAQLDLELVQMDVKTAFLHGDFNPQGSDDMLIASQSSDEIEKLKTRLKSEFEMKDLGEAKMILGMEIVRDRKLRKLCLTRKQYLRRVLKRFRFDKQTKQVSSPIASQFKISAAMSLKNDAERAYMEKVPYANPVGSLMYAMICTRPDISHAVGMVSRYMHNLGKGHWQAVKWILRYIYNTVDVGLVFEHGNSQSVEGYYDSDYVRDLDKRRSTTGYVITLAKALVSWKSTLQSTTALSTIEAEYMAMTDVVKEAIWLQGLLSELGIKQKFVTMHCDSQSVIHLAKN